MSEKGLMPILIVLGAFVVGLSLGFDHGHRLAVQACTAPATVISK